MEEQDKIIVQKLDKFFESKGFDGNEKVVFLLKMQSIYTESMLREITIDYYMDTLEDNYAIEQEEDEDEFDILDDDEPEEEDYVDEQPAPAPVLRQATRRQPSESVAISEPPVRQQPVPIAKPEQQQKRVPPKAPSGPPIIKRPMMNVTQDDIDKGDY